MSAHVLSQEELRESARIRMEKYSHHVPFTGCIIWAGAQKEHGYGVMSVGRVAMKAHRVAYALAHGLPLKRDGSSKSVLRHACDNPACVNPEHLVQGTQADNMSDAAKRVRMRHGERHHGAKLTDAQVMEIYALRGRESQAAIAKRFGIYQSVVSRMFSGKAWRHIIQGV